MRRSSNICGDISVAVPKKAVRKVPERFLVPPSLGIRGISVTVKSGPDVYSTNPQRAESRSCHILPLRPILWKIYFPSELVKQPKAAPNIIISRGGYNIRREPKGVLLKGGLQFYVFPLINVSSLVSTCFVQVETLLVHCPLRAAAQMMPHMFLFHCCAST